MRYRIDIVTGPTVEYGSFEEKTTNRAIIKINNASGVSPAKQVGSVFHELTHLVTWMFLKQVNEGEEEKLCDFMSDAAMEGWMKYMAGELRQRTKGER